MSKKDLCEAIAIDVIQTLVVMTFLVTIAAALIIIENITAEAVIMVGGVFAILIVMLVSKEIISDIRFYKLSKEEEL